MDSPSLDLKDYGIKILKKDREYKLLDWSAMPLFLSGTANLFEGNMVTLNVYSEHNSPREFSNMLALVMVFFTFFAAGMGTIGYMAFGDKTDPVILYNLPNQDGLSIAAKIAYLLTIAGSYLLLVQPVFKIIEQTSLVMSAAGSDP